MHEMLHTPDFDIDEDGLETGVANLSWLAFTISVLEMQRIIEMLYRYIYHVSFSF